ncbi:MAG: hypothetical protein RLZZ543_299 [Bacteroidota bacterium]|jgi:hypothetical protein
MRNALLLLSIFTLTSCAKVVDLGKLNMISDRNIDSKTEYVLIKNYAGGSDKEIRKALKKTKATTIDAAVDETVRNVPGGEYLKNVKLYGVMKKKKMYLLVEGDVWGIAGNESFRGFKVGDIVQWKELTVTKKGTITGLTDAEKCMVREDGKVNSQSVKYSSITKVVD